MSSVRILLRAWLVTAALVFSLASAAADTDLDTALPADPAIRVGRLPNGMEYWIRSHKTPPGRVGMWLHIDSGSLNEEDKQRGLAHFLEHVAFKGSAHFPGDTIVKRFETLGVSLGKHQNAFTGFDETTYTLALPNIEESTLRLGFSSLADIAFGLNLEPQAVEQERAIILEEARLKKGLGQRLLHKSLPLLAPGARLAQRLPIGDENVIRQATAKDLRAYYQKWYRPDNATLLIVGDIAPAALESLIAEYFAPWQPAPPVPDADPGLRPYSNTRAAVITDRELTRAMVEVEHLRRVPRLRTVGEYRERLVQDIGLMAMNKRLDDLIKSGVAPFEAAGAGASNLLPTMLNTHVSASGAPGQWAKMLEALLIELKRGRDHGFSIAEIEDVKKQLLAGAEHAARTEETEDASSFLSIMNSALRHGRRPISSSQQLDLLKMLLSKITPAEAGRAFTENYPTGARLLLISLPEKSTEALPQSAEVLKVARRADSTKAAALPDRNRLTTILEREPEPGKVTAQTVDKDLNVLSASLDNGVRVHVRRMDYRKNQVTVRIALAGGLPTETAHNRGVTALAELAFATPATAKFSATAIRDWLVGKNVSVFGYTDEGYLHLQVEGSPADLEDGLRLAFLLLTEARVEESAVALWRKKALQQLERRQFSLGGQLGEQVTQLFIADDPRFLSLTRTQIEQLTRAQGQEWLDNLLKTAPIEAAVVGDISTEQAMKLAQKYLGGLPKRLAPVGMRQVPPVQYRPGPGEAQIAVPTQTPRGEVFVGWRGADWLDVKDREVLGVAARILTRRLHDTLREQLGLVYSIGCYSSPAQVYAGNGRFTVHFSTDPEKAADAATRAQRMVEEFAKKGPNDDELKIARKQIENDLDTRLKAPEFWAARLTTMDSIGGSLDELKNPAAKLMRYSANDITRVLQKYIVAERRVRVISLPQPTQPADKALSQAPGTVRETAAATH